MIMAEKWKFTVPSSTTIKTDISEISEGFENELKSALKKDSREDKVLKDFSHDKDEIELFFYFLKDSRRAKFQDAIADVVVKDVRTKRRVERPTLAFVEGAERKKNLAYYDKSIYNILKMRKEAEVSFKKYF